jgi:hypothetical protein
MIGNNMYSYATNSTERKIIPLCLACISILAAWGFNRGFESTQLTLPWWIDVPSFVFFYGIIYFLFEKFVWRFRLLHKIKVVKVPDLNGDWKGYISSSFDTHAKKFNATLKIHQSWTHISIILRAENSRSHSLMASINIDSSLGTILVYEYINDPRPDAANTMHIHRGTVRFFLETDGKVLNGEYYSGRDRQTFGISWFERV